jgi:hypothetical protein
LLDVGLDLVLLVGQLRQLFIHGFEPRAGARTTSKTMSRFTNLQLDHWTV